MKIESAIRVLVLLAGGVYERDKPFNLVFVNDEAVCTRCMAWLSTATPTQTQHN